MKARTEIEKKAAAINDTLKEDIAVADMERVISLVPFNDIYKIWYFQLNETHQGEKVERLYRIYRKGRKDNYKHYFVEIGRVICGCYFTKQRTMGHYYDTFIFSSNIVLRDAMRCNYSGYRLIDIFTDMPVVTLNASKSKRVPTLDVSPLSMYNIEVKNPYAETLIKQGQEFLVKMVERQQVSEQADYFNSIRIAKKHGFVFNEETTQKWFDMLHAMIWLGADIHNPVYVAPNNLDIVHNLFVNRVNRKIADYNRRENEKRMIAMEEDRMKHKDEIAKANKEYVKARSLFFGFEVSDPNLQIHVLSSVDEFYEEGTAMNHCVFACKYYDTKCHPQSLILSCTDKQGNRVATIEINLKTFKVEQCYGKNDCIPKQSAEIKKLLNENMDKLKEIVREAA